MDEEFDVAMRDLPYESLLAADKVTDKQTMRREKREKPKVGKLKTKSRHGAEDAPKERTAKKPTQVEKQVFASKSQKGTDPRFDPEMDDFKKRKYHENYQFLLDLKGHENDMMKKEVRKLSRNKTKNGADIETFKSAIGDNKAFIKQQNRDHNILQTRYDIKQEAKDEGVILKKSEVKARLVEKLKANKSKRH